MAVSIVNVLEAEDMAKNNYVCAHMVWHHLAASFSTAVSDLPAIP